MSLVQMDVATSYPFWPLVVFLPLLLLRAKRDKKFWRIMIAYFLKEYGNQRSRRFGILRTILKVIHWPVTPAYQWHRYAGVNSPLTVEIYVWMGMMSLQDRGIGLEVWMNLLLPSLLYNLSEHHIVKDNIIKKMVYAKKWCGCRGIVFAETDNTSVMRCEQTWTLLLGALSLRT